VRCRTTPCMQGSVIVSASRSTHRISSSRRVEGSRGVDLAAVERPGCVRVSGRSDGFASKRHEAASDPAKRAYRRSRTKSRTSLTSRRASSRRGGRRGRTRTSARGCCSVRRETNRDVLGEHGDTSGHARRLLPATGIGRAKRPHRGGHERMVADHRHRPDGLRTPAVQHYPAPRPTTTCSANAGRMTLPRRRRTGDGRGRAAAGTRSWAVE
jgi:hypothetical protein